MEREEAGKALYTFVDQMVKWWPRSCYYALNVPESECRRRTRTLNLNVRVPHSDAAAAVTISL